MSVITAAGYTPSEGSAFTTDHPIIGWQDLVTPTSIAATSAATGFPATNLANPATFLKWQAAGINSPPSDEYLTVTTGTAPVDYLAIAAHNLSSAGILVSVEDIGTSPATQLTTPQLLNDNGPTLFRFTPISTAGIRLRLQTGSAAAQIGVMYAGKLLIIQRRIYANHTPITQGRTWKATNGMSENGQFLGRIVLSEFVQTKIPLSLLDPTWYRANFDPFLAQAQEIPFFFAWRPATYPNEVGYGWLTGMPAPTPTPPSNLIAVSLEMTGVA